MVELCHLACTPRTRGANVQVAQLADRQWGVVTRGQLEDCGLEAAGISRWIRSHRLHRIHPGVYGVGHAALGLEGSMPHPIDTRMNPVQRT